MNTTLRTIIACALLTISSAVTAMANADQTVVATVTTAETTIVNCSASGDDISMHKQVVNCLCMIKGLTQVAVYKTSSPEQWQFTAFYDGRPINGYVVIVSHH